MTKREDCESEAWDQEEAKRAKKGARYARVLGPSYLLGGTYFMERDVKEASRALMRIPDGGTISRAEIEDLAFDATGDPQFALDDAFTRAWTHKCVANYG
jgi:hypothetical protein